MQRYLSQLVADISLLIRTGIGSGSVPRVSHHQTHIETTSICNLACSLCPVSDGRIDRERKTIDEDDFRKIVDLTWKTTTEYCLHMFGEPLLHPSFFDLFAYVQKTGVPAIISSNLNLPEKTVNRLAECEGLIVVCSIDGYDQESYGRYRKKGDFDLVINNLKNLAQGKVRVRPQFLISEETEPLKPRYRELIRSIGIPEENIKFKRMNFNFGNSSEEGCPGVCHSLHRDLFFTCDGYLVPCCMNAGDDLYLPHVKEIQDAEWFRTDPRVIEMRRNLARDKNTYPSCRKCVDHVQMWPHFYKKYSHLSRRLLEKLGWVSHGNPKGGKG